MTELAISSGYRYPDPENPSQYKTSPDFTTNDGTQKASGKGHFHKAKTITTSQQPQQKVSQVIRCFKLVEFNVNNVFNKFWHHFHNFSYPMGRLYADPYTGLPAYKTHEEIIEELVPEAVKKQKQEETFVKMSKQA